MAASGAETDSLIGHQIGGYALVERIGEGGFGEVYRARHDDIRREVAIKVLHRRYSHDPEAIARFMAEARAVNQIAHAGIVEIFDFGRLDDGRHYAVMELIHGKTLRTVLAERGRLPTEEAIPILRAIAAAVDAAHAAGVAHRDLKPDNVFVLDGTPARIKLIDFGLAKLHGADAVAVTETGMVFGTPLYMSPEQCRGRGVDTRTDLYSFGALAYHVLAGAPPFAGEALELALHHLNDAPEAPSRRVPGLSSHVDRAVLALLAKDPATRPSPLVRAVDALAGSALLPAVRPARRRRPALAALALAASALAAAAYVVTRSASLAPYERHALPFRVVQSNLGTFRLSNGAMIYRDDLGWWRYDLATSSFSPALRGTARDFRELRDGRLVVARTPREVAIEDPRDGSRRLLTSATDVRYLTVDPAERWVVVNDDGVLLRFDLVTGASFRLADATSSFSTPRWSPDGTSVLWTHNRPGGFRGVDRLYLTRLADGATEKLAFPVACNRNEAVPASVAAFLPDGRIVYCAEDASGISLRAHRRGETEHEVLASFDPAVSMCLVDTSGDAITVIASRDRTMIRGFDLKSRDAEPRLLARDARGLTLSAISPDGETAYIQDGSGRLAQVASHGGTPSPTRRCGDLVRNPNLGHHGGYGVVWRGTQLVQWDLRFEGDAQIVRFRDLERCQALGEWSRRTRPHDNSLGAPVCTADRCLIGGRSTGRGVSVFELAAGSVLRELATVDTPHHMQPELALSPDGRVVVTGGLSLFRLDGDRLVEIPFEGIISALAWARDPSRLLVGTIGDNPGLWWVSFDGTREPIWRTTGTWIADLRPTRDDRVLMTMRSWQAELVLFDR